MMYDTRSQIFDVCLAGPNAGLPIAKLGAQQYLDLGVPASQLVLGVPWYGCESPALRSAVYAPLCMSAFSPVPLDLDLEAPPRAVLAMNHHHACL